LPKGIGLKIMENKKIVILPDDIEKNEDVIERSKNENEPNPFESAEIEKNCASCMFSEKMSVLHNLDMVCHRYPPVPITIPNRGTGFGQPLVNEKTFCGEWRRKNCYDH